MKQVIAYQNYPKHYLILAFWTTFLSGTVLSAQTTKQDSIYTKTTLLFELDIGYQSFSNDHYLLKGLGEEGNSKGYLKHQNGSMMNNLLLQLSLYGNLNRYHYLICLSNTIPFGKDFQNISTWPHNNSFYDVPDTVRKHLLKHVFHSETQAQLTYRIRDEAGHSIAVGGGGDLSFSSFDSFHGGALFYYQSPNSIDPNVHWKIQEYSSLIEKYRYFSVSPYLLLQFRNYFRILETQLTLGYTPLTIWQQSSTDYAVLMQREKTWGFWGQEIKAEMRVLYWFQSPLPNRMALLLSAQWNYLFDSMGNVQTQKINRQGEIQETLYSNSRGFKIEHMNIQFFLGWILNIS